MKQTYEVKFDDETKAQAHNEILLDFILDNYEIRKPLKTYSRQQSHHWITLFVQAGSFIDDLDKFKPVEIKSQKPINEWKQSEKGALDEYDGILSKLIPELKDVTESEIEESLESSRRSD